MQKVCAIFSGKHSLLFTRSALVVSRFSSHSHSIIAERLNRLSLFSVLRVAPHTYRQKSRPNGPLERDRLRKMLKHALLVFALFHIPTCADPPDHFIVKREPDEGDDDFHRQYKLSGHALLFIGLFKRLVRLPSDVPPEDIA